MPGVSKSSLQSLLSGEPLPSLPPVDLTSLSKYNDNEVEWKRKLLAYLRRLLQRITGPNIFNELIEQTTIQQYIQDLIDASVGSGAFGIGPITLALYANYMWVDGTTAFGGDLVGTIKIPTLGLRDGDALRHSIFIGEGNPSTDGFGVQAIRVSGKIVPNYTENYQFQVESDDGHRLYVDGNLELDNWGGATTDNTGNIALTAATAVPFVLEVVNSGGIGFGFNMKWSSSSETGSSWMFIPYSALRAP